MWYKVNEKGDITNISSIHEEGYSYTSDDIVFNFDGKKLVLKSETETEEYKAAEMAYKHEREIEDLRRRRERECFSVINRGEPWYRTLTDEQKAELDVWYAAWLDVTETEVIPEELKWLRREKG